MMQWFGVVMNVMISESKKKKSKSLRDTERFIDLLDDPEERIFKEWKKAIELNTERFKTGF